MPDANDIIYAHIGNLTKSRDEKTGYLRIKGIATDDSLDLDGQRCDPEWLKTAMSDWFKTGNIREMHQMSAIGKADKLTQSGTQFEIEGLIVDPLAAEKFETGVYGYLSIGIKGARVDTSAKALETAPEGWIRGGKVVEISGCDIGSNQNAKAAPAELVKTVGGVTAKTEILGEIDAEEDVLPPVVKTIREDAATFLELLKGVDITKAVDGEMLHDPAELAAVRDGLIAFLKAEIDEMATGEDERWDIDQLTCALDTFLSWWQDESFEGEAPSPFEPGDDMDMISLGVSPDTIKAARADDATDEQKAAPLAELRKSLGLEEIATKAEYESLQEVLKGLEAAISDVREMAAPGQPALRATLDQQNKSAEADELENTAARYMANAYAQTDKSAAAQYVDAATSLQKRAKELRQTL